MGVTKEVMEELMDKDMAKNWLMELVIFKQEKSRKTLISKLLMQKFQS